MGGGTSKLHFGNKDPTAKIRSGNSPVNPDKPDKIMAPGSPMESLRRRHMSYNRPSPVNPVNPVVNPVNPAGMTQGVDPKSPLVAVPIIETQIGMKRSTLPPAVNIHRLDSYPAATAEDYPDPGKNCLFHRIFIVDWVFWHEDQFLMC